jgi:hypothetical protein
MPIGTVTMFEKHLRALADLPNSLLAIVALWDAVFSGNGVKHDRG